MAKLNIKSAAQYVTYSGLVEKALEGAITKAQETVGWDAIEKSRRELGRGANGSKMPPRGPGQAPRRRVAKHEFGLHTMKVEWKNNRLVAGPIQRHAMDPPWLIEHGRTNNKRRTYLDLRLRHRDGRMRANPPKKMRKYARKEWNKSNSKTLRQTGYYHTNRPQTKKYYHEVSVGNTVQPRPFFSKHAQNALAKHDRILENEMRKRFKNNQIPTGVGFRIARSQGYKI